MQKETINTERKDLVTIVKESGLETSKAQYILDNFQDYFKIAAEWETKALAIKVERDDQITEMKMAGEARKFLAKKRIEVEKARKKLKEESLRESKAIDGIANVLKALIIPIEEYLEQQERFVEIREENKRKEELAEIERNAIAEKAERDKKEAEEKARIELENKRLKDEAEERDRKHAEELKSIEIEKMIIEDMNRREREAANKRAKEIEEQSRKEREAIEENAMEERKEKERLAKLLENQIECPFCHRKFKIPEAK